MRLVNCSVGKCRKLQFSKILRSNAKPIWDKIYAHPYLKEFGDGTLSISKFKYFLQQDHIYVVEYCRPLAIAISKADSAEEMKWFADLIIGGLTWEAKNEEMLAEMIGMSYGELTSAIQSPTSRAYSDFLVQVASTGTVAEFIASMSPCMLTYPEIGRMLKPKKGLDKVSAYRAWTDFYASDEAWAFAKQFDDKLDVLGETESSNVKNKMSKNFLIASRYEYMFWDMAYKEEKWLV